MNAKHRGNRQSEHLRVARIVEQTRVLGPGVRAIVSVQGCHLRCRGCHSPAASSIDGGQSIAVAVLARQLLDLPIDGVTYSGGGEPMLQADALTRLSDLLRSERPGLSLMSYTGYRYDALLKRGGAGQRELLTRLDLLVDGPYVQRLHAPLRWRGSSNQRLIALTGRHRDDLAPDEPAGMEFELDEDLGLSWVGVPERPGFVQFLQGIGADRYAATVITTGDMT